MNRNAFAVLGLLLSGCGATVPLASNSKTKFPEGAFVGKPPADRPYEGLGTVRGRQDFVSFQADSDDPTQLCRSNYNRAVKQLVEQAKKRGGDAVIDVKSVVFLMDGKSELLERPECADDGAEGQILVIGTAIKWKKPSDAPKAGT